MDRSFLSRPEVVAASRRFTCIRLATYEDAEEARMLAGMARTGSGQLENTVFTILTPDGTRQLVRGTRSPDHLFRNAGEMAEAMDAIAARYPGKALPASRAGLPAMKDVRLALNVAACDSVPLVVLYGTPAQVARLEKALAPLAWGDLRGRAVYARVTDFGELAAVAGARKASGILVVRPDTYGQSGQVVLQSPSVKGAALAGALAQALPWRADERTHMREGFRRGVRWETEVPVTDPHGRY